MMLQPNNHFPPSLPCGEHYKSSAATSQSAAHSKQSHMIPRFNTATNLSRYVSDSLSTQANTPDGSEMDERELQSDQYLHSCNSIGYYDGPDSPTFEIDVKPKKKTFHTQEEKQKFVQDYSRKLKTEMCKNWDTTGSCKFGDRCSFAHGSHELKGKQHLHSNYKTKPCKKYFLKGYCSYGHRCQYLHRELLRRPEFRDFATKVYADKKLFLPPIQETIPEDEAVLTRFKELRGKLIKQKLLAEELERQQKIQQEELRKIKKQQEEEQNQQEQDANSSQNKRLPIFNSIAPPKDKDNSPFELDPKDKDNSPFELDPTRPQKLNAFTDQLDFFIFDKSDCGVY